MCRRQNRTKNCPHAVPTRSRSYPVPGAVLGLKPSSHRTRLLSSAVPPAELLTRRYRYNPRFRLLDSRCLRHRFGICSLPTTKKN